MMCLSMHLVKARDDCGFMDDEYEVIKSLNRCKEIFEKTSPRVAEAFANF